MTSTKKLGLLSLLLLLLIVETGAWKEYGNDEHSPMSSWWQGWDSDDWHMNHDGFLGGFSKKCPAPNIPKGIIVDNRGPYENGATISGRCAGGGYILGPDTMVCVFGNWAPSFMGECSNGPQYSCPTPRPPRGGRLSSQGPFGSGDSVTGICDDGGYIIGVSSLICVMGHWAPSFFGDCTNSQRCEHRTYC
ncbi:hypothetical protein RB195_016832 [Necator americanus]|uniref:Sushi domain-containing protein n=1 Tax=Necator americanus TaxID=51031 RepID=A0ABR1C634_NECAM